MKGFYENNEKHIINKEYTKVSNKYFEKCLSIYNKNVPTIEKLGIYSIFNSLLPSKPGEFVIVYEIGDGFIEAYPLSEFTDMITKNDIFVYSKKMKAKLLIETWNKINLNKRSFINAKYIEKADNDIIMKINLVKFLYEEERLDKYLKEFRESEIKNMEFITPFNHLPEYILNKYITSETFVYWDIGEILKPFVYASTLKKYNENILKLKKSKEIVFQNGAIVYLEVDGNNIMAKCIKGKVRINNRYIKNKLTKIAGIEDLERGIVLKTNREAIIVRARSK